LKNNKKWIVLFLVPTIILFAIIYAISIVVLFGTSFTDWSIGSKLKFIGIDNYIHLLTHDSDFTASFINTIIWISLQATVHVLIGLIFALILAKKEFYWKFARTVYMFPNIISSAALGMLYLCILNPDFGAVNGLFRLIGFKDFSQNWFMDYSTSFLAVTMTWLPFAAVVTILILAEMAAISDSIFEAAKVDGAGELQISLFITIPMLRNIIGTCAILAGTNMLQKLDIILMTTNGGPGNKTLNLPLNVYFTALRDNNFGYANAQGVVLIGIGILTVIIISRMFKLGNSVA
jgi:raffinose/stachyose/melibiose transport system permease protein